MSGGHWIALGTFLVGLATQAQGLHSWSEFTSVPFVCGIVMNLGSVIIAMASKQIGRDQTSRERDDDKS